MRQSTEFFNKIGAKSSKLFFGKVIVLMLVAFFLHCQCLAFIQSKYIVEYLTICPPLSVKLMIFLCLLSCFIFFYRV